MPIHDAHVFDIARVIQLAIAPVFMLTAVAGIINALLGRLARAVDRQRVVEELLPGLADEAQRAERLAELAVLDHRIRLVIWAIALAVLSAALVCLLIGGAFVGAYIATDISGMVALLFFASVVALTVSLLIFLREVLLTAASLNLGARGRHGDSL
jgi:hypothetical protein